MSPCLLDRSPPLTGREAAARSPAAGLPPLPQMCLEAKARAGVTDGRLRHAQQEHHTDRSQHDHPGTPRLTLTAMHLDVIVCVTA
jgi:hypothetical protein